eukprot:2528607-Amphidinium_carterae.1
MGALVKNDGAAITVNGLTATYTRTSDPGVATKLRIRAVPEATDAESALAANVLDFMKSWGGFDDCG